MTMKRKDKEKERERERKRLLFHPKINTIRFQSIV
jgi:hypothetical protein